jgi:group I intron endonuclease
MGVRRRAIRCILPHPVSPSTENKMQKGDKPRRALMPKRSGIYKITSPSGKFYIGSAVDMQRRCHEHRTGLRRGSHCTLPLQKAYVKYGIEKLEFSAVLYCRREDLIFFEQICIDGLGPQYNLRRIANSFLGLKHSESTKKKLRILGSSISEQTRQLRRAAALKQWADKDAREKIKGAIKLAANTPETRAKNKIVQANRKPISDETRAKMSASAIARGNCR